MTKKKLRKICKIYAGNAIRNLIGAGGDSAYFSDKDREFVTNELCKIANKTQGSTDWFAGLDQIIEHVNNQT